MELSLAITWQKAAGNTTADIFPHPYPPSSILSISVHPPPFLWWPPGAKRASSELFVFYSLTPLPILKVNSLRRSAGCESEYALHLSSAHGLSKAHAIPCLRPPCLCRRRAHDGGYGQRVARVDVSALLQLRAAAAARRAAESRAQAI
eukprot:6020270-Pleurochrysis_carterae.AAC.2